MGLILLSSDKMKLTSNGVSSLGKLGRVRLAGSPNDWQVSNSQSYLLTTPAMSTSASSWMKETIESGNAIYDIRGIIRSTREHHSVSSAWITTTAAAWTAQPT